MFCTLDWYLEQNKNDKRIYLQGDMIQDYF